MSNLIGPAHPDHPRHQRATMAHTVDLQRGRIEELERENAALRTKVHLLVTAAVQVRDALGRVEEGEL